MLSKKLEAIGRSLEQLSRNASVTNRSNNYTPRRSNSYYPHHQPTVELEPFPHDNLAQRLGLTPAKKACRTGKTQHQGIYQLYPQPRPAFVWVGISLRWPLPPQKAIIKIFFRAFNGFKPIETKIITIAD
ncbi:hypothetical protein [Nostoc sp. WHI]|uniref:hypothetical protein n=1 Tax=Nostoc sp. WHI TaxID=2650611 RepID=UPI002ED9DCD7